MTRAISICFFVFLVVFVFCGVFDWMWKTRRQTNKRKEQEKQKSIELKNFQDATTEKQFVFYLLSMERTRRKSWDRGEERREEREEGRRAELSSSQARTEHGLVVM